MNEENINQNNEILNADETAAASPEQFEIVGVRFKNNGKIYYFAPGDLKLDVDMHVIVETSRGMEFGFVAIANRTVPAKEVVLPLRSVIRTATEEDEERHEKNVEKETEAFNICLDKIELHKLDMKLVDVEYTFDNSKLLFYFTAEGRIDFRDLVKDLASIFRTRIELRQIGIRDEAKMMGGLGVCGRPFCCCSFLDDFVQVSIKMAKEQNLSLNSAKISGTCGRLMCCLRYEYDTYVEEIAKTPKIDSVVLTPEGEGVVVETTPLAGLIKVKMNDAPEQPPRVYHRDDVKLPNEHKNNDVKENDQKKPEETNKTDKNDSNGLNSSNDKDTKAAENVKDQSSGLINPSKSKDTQKNFKNQRHHRKNRDNKNHNSGNKKHNRQSSNDKENK